MSRIQLTDTSKDVLIKMADGNIGALTALMEILTKGAQIDPDNFMGGIGSILLLDTYGIYGSEIYVLWSDVCNKDTSKLLAIIRACQLGLFNSGILKDAGTRQDYSGKKMIPVDELYLKVRDQLPNFDLINQTQ